MLRRPIHNKSKPRLMPMFMSFRPALSSVRSVLRQLLALTLVIACIAGPTAPIFAQAVPAAPMMLHITILDGEDSLNNIRERTAREPIVQVEDENHKPVAGALLIFSIQNGGTGAGGTFNGLSTLSVTTDSEGKAIAHGLKPNATSGSYTISVTATLGTLVAMAVIHQSNIVGAGGGGTPVPTAPVTPETPVAPTGPVTESPAPSGGSSTPVSKIRRNIRHIPKKVWITGTVIVVTGVVVGTVVATHGGSSTTITPGTGTVGP